MITPTMAALDVSLNPSLNEIVSSLAARVNKQHDLGFLDELKHIVNYKRSKILYEWMKNLPLRNFLFQNFVIGTERVSATECEEFPSECYIVRTECEVPNPFRDPRIKLPYGIFDYVGHSSGYKPYSYLTREHFPYLKYRPYTADTKKWFYSNGFVYVINDKDEAPNPVMIRGVFQDPIINIGCNVCDAEGTICSPNTAPYPVPPEMLDEIINAVIREELATGDLPKEIDEEKDTIKVDSTEKIIHQNI